MVVYISDDQQELLPACVSFLKAEKRVVAYHYEGGGGPHPAGSKFSAARACRRALTAELQAKSFFNHLKQTYGQVGGLLNNCFELLIEMDVIMGKVYEHVTTFRCFDIIYRQGLSFGEAGRHLIESSQTNLFVPGMINICLATEIFLKSINASYSCLEDEIDIDGVPVVNGRDDTLKINPSGQGHFLSKLFNELPIDAKKEISALSAQEGFSGDVFNGLKQYDDVFVEWRYIYEKNDPRVLGTSPLFEIFNAINSYCKIHAGKIRESVANEIDEASWMDEKKKKDLKKIRR